MRILLSFFLVAAASFAHAQELPVAVGRADVSDEQASGWVGTALAVDTPAENDYLRAILAPVTGNGEPIVNDALLSKQTTWTAADLARVYNVEVKTLPNGSVQFVVWRDIGMSIWSASYTVSRRDGRFVISGLDYSNHHQGESGSCSMNFLTGRASINGGALVPVQARPIAFGSATELQVLLPCQRLLGLR